jgi:hypothetical protein
MARRKFLAQLSTLPFLAWGTRAEGSEEAAEDHNEKCLGTG